jgi:hypothetical protein
MSLLLEKESLKKEIDKVQNKHVLQAIKTLLEYANAENDMWEDEQLVAELETRMADYKSGKVTTYSLAEVEAAARKSRKRK